MWHQMYKIRHLTSDVCCQTSDFIHHISHIRRLSSDLKHLLFDVRIWCQTFDERWQTSGVWYMFDVRCQTSNVSCMMSHIRCLTSDVWDQASEIRHQMSDIRYLTSDVWNKTSDIWRMRSDVWLQTSYISHIRRLTWKMWHHMSEIRSLTSDICCQTYDIKHYTYHTSDVWHLISDIWLHNVTSDWQLRSNIWDQTSDIRHVTSDIWDQTSHIRCLRSDISHIRHLTSDTYHTPDIIHISHIRHLISDLWLQTFDIGCLTWDIWNQTSDISHQTFEIRPVTFSGHLGHDYLIKYAYFDKMLFRTVCFYQWSWKLNYKCSLMALPIWVHFRSSYFRHVTDNWELTVKIFTLKWEKNYERANNRGTF